MNDYQTRKKFKSKGFLKVVGNGLKQKSMNTRYKGQSAGSYSMAADADRLGKYMLREGEAYENRKSEIIAWGALGAPEIGGTKAVIDNFRNVWKQYIRGGKFGRYVYHEVYSLRTEDELLFEGSYDALDSLARELARCGYYEQGYQVLYAVHRILLEDAPRYETTDCYVSLGEVYAKENIHIHFMINAVNFETLHKRHSYFGDRAKREELFNEITKQAAHQYLGCRTAREFQMLQEMSDSKYMLFANYLKRIHKAGYIIQENQNKGNMSGTDEMGISEEIPKGAVHQCKSNLDNGPKCFCGSDTQPNA